MKSLWNRPGGKLIIAILSILAAGAFVMAAEPLFGRQTLVVEIEWIDAVEECSGSGGKAIFNSRSDAPTRSGDSYCGFIQTSHGLIQLPEDSFLSQGPRKEMLHILRENCSFEIIVAGYGLDLYEGQPRHNRDPKTLRSIERVFECREAN